MSSDAGALADLQAAVAVGRISMADLRTVMAVAGPSIEEQCTTLLRAISDRANDLAHYLDGPNIQVAFELRRHTDLVAALGAYLSPRSDGR